MCQQRKNHLKQCANEDCGIFAKVVGVCGLWMIVTGTNDPSLLMDISLSPTGLSATCCVSPQQFGEYLHWTFLGHWWDLTKQWLRRAETKCVGQANEIKNRTHLIKTRGKESRRHEEIKSNQLWRLPGHVVTHQICFILLFHLSELSRRWPRFFRMHRHEHYQLSMDKRIDISDQGQSESERTWSHPIHCHCHFHVSYWHGKVSNT